MQITIHVESPESGCDRELAVDIPDPLTNTAGAVEVTAGRPRIIVAVDALMAAAGITTITPSYGRTGTHREWTVLIVGSNRGEGNIVLDTRPELRDLVANRQAIATAIDTARTSWQAAQRDAVDVPLLAAMHAREAQLVTLIPPDHVRVTVRQTGDLDGDPILDYAAEGLTLAWDTRGLMQHGWAHATRPGALDSFAAIGVYSISPADLEAERTRQTARAHKRTAAAAALEHDLTTTPVPPGAIAAYTEYAGDAERAWEAEDETSWAQINRWAPYIEAQHLAPEAELATTIRETRMAAREDQFGVGEGE